MFFNVAMALNANKGSKWPYIFHTATNTLALSIGRLHYNEQSLVLLVPCAENGRHGGRVLKWRHWKYYVSPWRENQLESAAAFPHIGLQMSLDCPFHRPHAYHWVSSQGLWITLLTQNRGVGLRAVILGRMQEMAPNAWWGVRWVPWADGHT